MDQRFQEFERDQLDTEQRAVFDRIASGPRGTVPRIFHLYLHSAELAGLVERLGAHCRYASGLPIRLSELAILIVAKHWDAAYEWSIHQAIARRAGVPDAMVDAIGAGETPRFDDEESKAIHEFVSTYLRTNDVPDALFGKTVALLGMKTTVELAGVIGYYSMLAMTIRIFRIRPEGT